MEAKRRWARRGISAFSEEKDESETENDADPNQAEDKYPLQL